MIKFLIEPINDNDCRIIGVDCSALAGEQLTEVTVPSTVEHDGKVYQVKEVGDGVLFTNKFDEDTAKYAALKRLSKIVFAEGIEAIGGVMNTGYASNADQRGNAETLTEVSLPSTLKVIGTNAFNGCKMLEKINIPDSVEEIGECAFNHCEQLLLFQWPKSLKKVGSYAFYDMKKPVDENGKSTFELVIPDSIEEISYNPYGVIRIARCVVSPKGFEVLNKIRSQLKDGSFGVCCITNGILSIDIPEGVTRILAPFESLEHVSLPSTLEEIGDDAFYSSRVLDSLTELPKAIKKIGPNAFAYALKEDKVVTLRIPSNPEIEVGPGAFNSTSNAEKGVKIESDEATLKALMGQPGALTGTLIESMDIPEGSTAAVCVGNCPILTTLNIPSSVTEVEIISKCPKLESLTIPDSVIKINILKELPTLTDLILPAKLESLGKIVECPSLTTLTLPDSLKSIKCLEGLKAEIKASPEVWEIICATEYAMSKYSPAGGTLTLPEGVTSIAKGLLKESRISSIAIPSTVTEIGPYAFSGCDKLENLTFVAGSKLTEIGAEALTGTALKEIVLPVGMKKISSELIKDVSTLETVVFPASMSDYGFEVSRWGDVSTAFVRCKNLKQFIFLADDPATAVYPVALGKMADWYVPDSMVDFVKASIEKAKADYPNVKGVGAKSVKPLSKLKGYVLPGATQAAKPAEAAPAPTKKAAAKKKEVAMTQRIQMEAFGVNAKYCFAVDPNDMHMLDNELDRSILAIRYLRDKATECAFEFVGWRMRGSNWTVDELSLLTNVNSASAKLWHSTAKSSVDLDFGNAESLPADFPMSLVPELAQTGGFINLLKARCPNFTGKLPEGAPAYMEVRLGIRIRYDFMIGEKEKFNVNKITVMHDWDCEPKTDICWRFGMMYNGRYIPASSVGAKDGEYMLNIKAYETMGGNKINCVETVYDDVKYSADYCEEIKLPYIDEILSLVNSK